MVHSRGVTPSLHLHTEILMKKFTTLAAAAAIATTASAPVLAQSADATVLPDPFVSTAGPAIGLTPGLIAAGLVITVLVIAAADGS